MQLSHPTRSLKLVYMKKLTALILLISFYLLVQAVVYYDCISLPSNTLNYANITLPTDILNNITEMDNTPANNPTTDAGATLGRVLFYDKDLSKNNSISCASCHIQKFGFSDTARFSMGFNGQRTRRNSMGLIHARFEKDSAFFWDNRAPSLEAQTLIPFQSPVEMGMTLDTLIARISSKTFYAPLYQAAFGSPSITPERTAKALAQFVRSMNSFGSKFRQGINSIQGNPAIVPFPNFTAQENLGKDLFMDIRRGNCQACHTRNIMVQQGSKNIGLDLVYADNGVGETIGNRTKDGQFSVPSLMNIALTAPYMHDGRYKTLEEVINFYSDSVKAHPNLDGFLREIIPGNPIPNNNPCDTCPPRKPHYSIEEKAALVAFLKTLTDTTILSDERWSDPFCLNSVTGIRELEGIFSVKVYPNPALSGGRVILQWVSGKPARFQICLYTLSGQQVKHYTVNTQAGNNQATLQLPVMQSGIYSLVLQTPGTPNKKQLVSIY